MDKKLKTIENLRDIYGYGYTEVFTEVTDSITTRHISRTQMNIIQHIYLRGSATPSELAEVLNVQKSAVTHTVKKLEHKKLVTVKENTHINDKRSKLVFMTGDAIDQKSTRLNSSHVAISYTTFCLIIKT